MSEVFSFRLDKNNPREQRAIEVLNAWQNKGYSLRFAITEALIKLDENRCLSNKPISSNEYRDVLAKVKELINCVAEKPFIPFENKDKNNSQTALADSFVASVKKATKPGLKIE